MHFFGCNFPCIFLTGRASLGEVRICQISLFDLIKTLGNLVGNQPIWKICSSIWLHHLPKARAENSKKSSNSWPRITIHLHCLTPPKWKSWIPPSHSRSRGHELPTSVAVNQPLAQRWRGSNATPRGRTLPETKILLMVQKSQGQPPGMLLKPYNGIYFYHINWWRISEPSTVAPENGWLENDLPFGTPYFQVRTVSFREGNPCKNGDVTITVVNKISVMIIQVGKSVATSSAKMSNRSNKCLLSNSKKAKLLIKHKKTWHNSSVVMSCIKFHNSRFNFHRFHNFAGFPVPPLLPLPLLLQLFCC